MGFCHLRHWFDMYLSCDLVGSHLGLEFFFFFLNWVYFLFVVRCFVFYVFGLVIDVVIFK